MSRQDGRKRAHATGMRQAMVERSKYRLRQIAMASERIVDAHWWLVHHRPCFDQALRSRFMERIGHNLSCCNTTRQKPGPVDGSLFVSIDPSVQSAFTGRRLTFEPCRPLLHRSMALLSYSQVAIPQIEYDSHSSSSYTTPPSCKTMTADPLSSDSYYREPACYFSIPSAGHFSLETPLATPTSEEYNKNISSDPSNPLLARRSSSSLYMSNPGDASRLLQLQTAAAHRPSAEPLQQRASSTSSSNSSSSTSNFGMASPQPCCCRCRRESYGNIFQIGTNRYYCSHCARMTGYSAG